MENAESISEFSLASLEAIRNRLLDLTSRNRLLNFKHRRTGLLRVIDELPDQLAQALLDNTTFTFLPVDEPTEQELIEHQFIQLDENGLEQKLKNPPKAYEWAKIKGFDPHYELAYRENSEQNHHNDTYIQTLLYPRELEAQLRKIRQQANLAIEETGANILYLALGFLQWFEDSSSSTERLAPLYLIPVRVEKAKLDRETGVYRYSLQYTGEDIVSNLSLREKLRTDFALELPEIADDTLPEAYLKLIAERIIQHKPKWAIKRFATLAMFDFGKLLMYLDLDPDNWPQGDKNIQNHPILQQFFASVENDSDGYGFATEYDIDSLENVHGHYPLIDDADSSQHSALVDAIKGQNLVIEGPPGTGKSQTITNLIAAALAQNKKVLFVAEKMAALQVVQSRLERAGLGDFCLELHSNKTQKKQVYENLAKRLSAQGQFRYPSSIDTDIQMYEEKKQALTDYAALINSEWKKTGQTIHQIFSTATLLRARYPDLKVESIQQQHLDGSMFDELTARRMSDHLRRYADVYDEVRKQLGDKAALIEHPWFGVKKTTIQMFDCDSICALLDSWQQSLAALNEQVIPLCARISDAVENPSLAFVAALIADYHALPCLSGTEFLDSLDRFNEERAEQLDEYVKAFASLGQAKADLNRVFVAEQLNEERFERLDNALSFLQAVCKRDAQLSEIYQWQQLSAKLLEQACAIAEHISLVEPQLRTDDVLFSRSIDGFSDFRSFIALTTNLEPGLVGRRHELFDNDGIDKNIDQLDAILVELKSIKGAISTTYNLSQLPPSSQLKDIQSILDSAGWLRWFDSSWRAAKQRLCGLAVSLKPRLNDLHQQLPQLIEYTTLMEKLTDNQKFISSFQHEYKAEATAIEDIKALRSWYKRVRDTFGVGFGPKVALANQLFALADDVFKGAAHLAKHQALADLDSVNSMMNQLVDVLDLEGLSNASVNLVGPQGSVTKAASKLQANLRDVQPAVKADLLLSETKLYAAQLGLWLDRMKAFETNTIEVELFEQRYLIDLDQWDSGVCQSHLDTLALYHAIQALQCDSLKHFLTKHINAGILAEIATDMANIEQLFKSQEEAKDTFSQCVDLDVEAWFKQAEKALEGWIKRNDTALENPKWLVSWVDFIRNRSKLAEQGLDNLLHKIELGDIALEDIEGIYQYSVFDMLSREIITEEQSLAHFSGADHNAIRKQFQHYDNKLKALQREKVAHAVAQGGIEHVLSGVASGRVADYTEMGLIQNEVNKKTRHVPIRQLIKRAGKSVAALKPCFLMGPNSVAQYLAPGEIEFDLVIMDEASQIKPQDALGTIARGKQVVVVGDPKQLPPTSFFDKNVDSDDEEAMAIEQSESILDVSLPMFSARRLRWHYRSRHESLIAFSNKEFYDSNLVVFPSPSSQSDEFGVKFSYIKRGRFVNSRNIEEAQIIAWSARKHLLNHAGESLGIVAMNSQQREQIERCIEELAKEDALFAEALSRNQASEEPLFIKNLENVQGDERDVIYISFTYGPQEAGASAMPQRFGPINSAAGGRRLNVLFTRSKKRMHIFSSMKEGHIRATDKSSVGVHALRRFLGYAESGRLEQAQITGKGPDSNFEVSVMEALQREGFTCEPQIGVAGYFIDLAVRDPNQPGRFLMGIECDGATYHSAKSARDRDRLRQSVLEGLGWKIHRIWSTDWFKNPQAQLVPLLEQLRQLSSELIVTEEGSSSELTEIFEEIALDDQQHLCIDDISAQPLTLEQKLQAFAERIDKQAAAVSQNKHVLRPAMIAALVKYQPVNKNEFVEFLPSYLIQGTAADHRIYLSQIFNIIAEHEEEKEASLERITTEIDE